MSVFLLVNDSPTQSHYLQLLLQSLGHHVCACNSRDLALERLDALSIDLALVALLTSSSNGFELGVRLRSYGCKRVAIVAKNPRDTDVQWAQALGLLGVLDVPSSIENTKQQLSVLLQA